MKFLRLFAFSIISCSALLGHNALASGDRLHSELETIWNAFLEDFVDTSGNLDYGKLKADSSKIDRAYDWIKRYSPDSHPEIFPSEDARFSYWLNAYNIATIYGVIEHYPVQSVREIKPFSVYSLFSGGGFFAAKKFTFGGKKLSLYKLENKLIRKRFDDPRLHFALNCASIGCPELPQEAFQTHQLHQQLEIETEEFINASKNFRIDHSAKEIQLSSIFDWYDEDFIDPSNPKLKKEPRLLAYVERYLTAAARADLKKAQSAGYKVSFIAYDWSLNDQN